LNELFSIPRAAEIAVITAQRRTGAGQAGGDRQTQRADALVVDLLPAGLELENQNLANSSASLQENGDAVQNLLNQMQQADIQHIEFRDDRFVAAVAVNEGQPVTLVYLARAVTPGTYQVPQPQVESMYVPQWRATGAASGPLTVTP
jgi:uncharacterized protein YfaS (alpha-2-macroglobulin family)